MDVGASSSSTPNIVSRHPSASVALASGDDRRRGRSTVCSRILRAGAVTLVVLSQALGSTAAQAHQVSHLESYRVLTYNVAGMDIPQVFLGWDIPLGEEYSTLDLGLRAQRIADFIKAGDYDIVLL